MVEGGGRACAQSWESGLPWPPRGCRAATRDARGEGLWATGCPCPRQGLLGTLPARLWPPLRATSSLPVLPPGLPPGWGREPAAAAGLGEPGGCRLGRGSGARREAEDDPVRVGQRSAGQSVRLEGRPCRGWGGRAIQRVESAPRGGGRAGRAAGTVWFGWQAGTSCGGKGLSVLAESGARGRARLGSPAPDRGSLGDSASVPGDLAGPPGGAAGRAPSRSEPPGLEIFRISAPTRRSRRRKHWHFIQTVRIADFLKSYNFLFSFLSGPSFSLNKM